MRDLLIPQGLAEFDVGWHQPLENISTRRDGHSLLLGPSVAFARALTMPRAYRRTTPPYDTLYAEWVIDVEVDSGEPDDALAELGRVVREELDRFDNPTVDSVRIEWSNGYVQVLDPEGRVDIHPESTYDPLTGNYLNRAPRYHVNFRARLMELP